MTATARVALYARVSTFDKVQDPETQLMPLREYCAGRGWAVVNEYVDHASANDLRGRRHWRKLLDDGAKRRFGLVLVWKLDRAFRSVKHMHETLSAFEIESVDFQSLREQFDTSTAMGRLLLNLMASLAEFELEQISERVKAGMDRAKRQGKPIGRQPVLVARPDLKDRLPEVLERVAAGRLSKKAAAEELEIGQATLYRLAGWSKT